MHMRCCDPPLTQMPGSDEDWFCQRCVGSGSPAAAAAAALPAAASRGPRPAASRPLGDSTNTPPAKRPRAAPKKGGGKSTGAGAESKVAEAGAGAGAEAGAGAGAGASGPVTQASLEAEVEALKEKEAATRKDVYWYENCPSKCARDPQNPKPKPKP